MRSRSALSHRCISQFVSFVTTSSHNQSFESFKQVHTYLTYTYHTMAVNSESEKIRTLTEDNFRERVIDVLAVVRREKL